MIKFLTIFLAFLVLLSLAEFITGNLSLEFKKNLQMGSAVDLRSNLEHTKIEINPQSVQAGEVVTIDIYPGKEGIFTGLAIYSSGGKRKYGNLCSQQSSADICSETYVCIDSNPDRCNSGPKCYGAKRIKVRTSQNWAPGTYTAKICEAVDECWKCNSPATASFFVN